MLDAHAHVMQVKLCKANTRGVTLDALAAAAAVSAAARSRSFAAASSASCRRRVLEATER